MTYTATVYRIMFGSPSDIKEEIQVAFQVLNHWNSLHSEQSKIVLLPLNWSISSYPAMGKHPQKILDEQVVEKSDLLICIFGTRLGSPTDTEISGSVEEIKEHRKAGKDVLVFFKQSVDNLSSVDLQQLQGIKDFKESIKNDVLWCEFSDVADFKNKLSDALQRYVSEHWFEKAILTIDGNHTNKIVFDEEEKQILTRWAQGNNPQCIRFVTQGKCYYAFGKKAYEALTGKDQAYWDDFLERLLQNRFVKLDRYEEDGKPVYKLTKAAYDYVDTITEKKN